MDKMTQKEFVDLVIGKPWVSRDISLDGMDCYGLVVLYYRHVLGIDIQIPDGYFEFEEPLYLAGASKCNWEETNGPSNDGIMFVLYNGESPRHVGITLNRTHVLHSRFDERDQCGSVQINSLSAIRKLYGKVTFHRYIGK